MWYRLLKLSSNTKLSKDRHMHMSLKNSKVKIVPAALHETLFGKCIASAVIWHRMDPLCLNLVRAYLFCNFFGFAEEAHFSEKITSFLILT